MTKRTEDTPKKKGKGTSVVVWVLMAMLVLGLGGFGVTNFGGGVTAIGQVGEREIDVNDYARALQQEMNALSAQFGTQINMQQAQTLGIDRQVRQRLINSAALDNETDRIGISAGDARIAQEITASQNFRGPSGKFDRETYRFTLERNRLTEAQYEKRLREDLARALLQGAVTGGFAAPAPLIDTLYAHISERRGFSLLHLTDADIGGTLAEPTEEDISTYYTENIASFTRPEARRITYAALLPEDILDQVKIDNETLRRLYDERINEFVQPERRLVERLVFPTDEAAADAKARIDAGTPFDTVVEERGVTLSDIDLGDKAEGELGSAGPAIFSLAEPGIVGPFNSDLGPALFRMNGILAAQNTSFDDAQEDLSAELVSDAARRIIADQIEGLDDKLASGATLEDLADETDMSLAQIDFTATSDEAIAGYTDFRAAAEAVEMGAFPEIIELEDGGIFALRLDAIVPPAPIPLDEARDAVEENWRAATEAKALSERAIAIKSEVEAGASLGGFGILDVNPAITRSSTIEDAPANLVASVFEMDEGEIRVFDKDGFIGILKLDSITPGALDGEDAVALKAAISAQAEQAIAQDAFSLFTNALTTDAGISLNNAAISAVHAQFQ